MPRFTPQQLAEARAQLASMVTASRHGDKAVNYGSIKEQREIVEMMERDQAQAPRVRMGVAIVDRG